MKNILTITLLTAGFSFGQTDFNDYTPLKSGGSIPEEFTKHTYEKLQDEENGSQSKLSAASGKRFFEGINYAVDDLMHSGYVTFGDPISKYVNDVADKLLKNDKDLKSKLRFYTIKSNVTNAFSTDQGIVFVTTGLLSQITSEAQLALVLAHEISHYTEHHVLESFIYRKNNRYRSIEQMSVYAKDKEYEADKLGLEIYAAAGYSKDEVLSTFDVLLYSYLPFDEIDIDLSYFKSADSLYLPSNLFPNESFEIKAVEDEDDNQSTHPNIKKRKDTLIDQLEGIKFKGDDVYKLGQERFIEVRNIARFEAVRNDVFHAQYGKALYSIYLLEKQYPESLYLQRMKAQSWYGILQYTLEDDRNEVLINKDDFEGSSANLHYFIKEMSKDQVIAMSIRQLRDLNLKYPDDKEISLINNRLVKDLVYSEVFNINNFANIGYFTAEQRFYANQVKKEEDTVSTSSSKYDRIKEKRDVNKVTYFDSLEFQKYLIPDAVMDQNFLNKIEKYQLEFDKEQEEEETYNAMSYSERIKYDKAHYYDEQKIGLTDVIVVEPTVLSINKRGINRIKSEKIETDVNEMLEFASLKSGVNVYTVSSEKLALGGVNLFNERSVLLNYLEQVIDKDDISPFPVDYSQLRNIERNYGTNKIAFTWFTHQYNPQIGFDIVLSIICYPSLPIYLPLKLMSGNRSELTMIILDTENGTVDAAINQSFKSNVKKHIIGAHLYSAFTTFKEKQQ